jgi:hypothetical protein
LCIGGHKHTYALSYPIKENYQWKVKGDNGEYGEVVSSLTQRKPMIETLEDESGSNPSYDITWVVTANKDVDGNPYNISTGLSGDVSISSTKVPYIPENLYNIIGAKKFADSTNYYRCCTPVDTTNNMKYDGFVNYSMCQATGYKLKSNKELPCAYQVFSKLIPMTSNVYEDGKFTDTVNENQLYPLYSVLEFIHEDENISAIDVKLCRVRGIFKKDGKDSFTQTSYGANKISDASIDYLIEVKGGEDEGTRTIDKINEALGYTTDDKKIKESNCMYGVWVPKGAYFSQELDGAGINKYLYIQY